LIFLDFPTASLKSKFLWKNPNDSAHLAVLNTVGAQPSNPAMKARITFRPFAVAIGAWLTDAKRRGTYGRAVYADIRALMAHGSHDARLEFMRRPFFPRHDGRWRYVGRVGRAALWRAPRTGRYYAFILDKQGYLVAEAVGESRDTALHHLLRRLPRS
jgi:hypothetical protein